MESDNVILAIQRGDYDSSLSRIQRVLDDREKALS